MIRVCDFCLSLAALVLLFPLLVVLLVLVFLANGSPLFFQERVGRNQRTFLILKFRTMKPGTASVATHMIDPVTISPFGRFLRKSKLDELPQLWNVLRGEMSLVGPRPCLTNQYELITKRNALGVFDARPGISGLAQLQGVDMSDPERLSHIEAEMLNNLTLALYFRYIILTLMRRDCSNGINDRN